MLDLECSGLALQSGSSLAEAVDAGIDRSLQVGNGLSDWARAGRPEFADEQLK